MDIDGCGSYDGPIDLSSTYAEKKIKDESLESKNLIIKLVMDKYGITDSDQLLIKLMMDKYGITDSDLYDVNIVKSKLRDFKIDQIVK